MSATHDFVTTAKRYRAFVEVTEGLDPDDIVLQLQEHLLALYGGAVSLSVGDPSDSDLPAARHEEWAALHQRLGSKLGDFDYYSLVFDPYDLEAKPVVGSLADDIASIYQDLGDGLVMIEGGESLEAAVWQWRWSFDNHWGRHAAHALYAVFSLTHPGSLRSIRTFL